MLQITIHLQMSVTGVEVPVIPTVPTSFIYEDFVSHIETVQDQINGITTFVDEQQKNDKKVQNELKSRSLTFVDLYGNPIVKKYMDHELIGTVLRKCKKNYVPKYFHQWVKFGRIIENVILPLDDCELKSTVSKYAGGYQFVAYGEVNLCVLRYGSYTVPLNFVIQVRLSDNMEKIERYIKERQIYTTINLKSSIVNQNIQPTKKDWNEGTALKSEDTIMSAQLYQDNCVIIAKIHNEKVSSNFFF